MLGRLARVEHCQPDASAADTQEHRQLLGGEDAGQPVLVLHGQAITVAVSREVHYIRFRLVEALQQVGRLRGHGKLEVKRIAVIRRSHPLLYFAHLSIDA